MLGLVGLLINGAAAWRLVAAHAGLVSTLAIGSTVASFWSWGVMMNYSSNPTAAPNWSANVNMLSMVAGIVFLIWSFVV